MNVKSVISGLTKRAEEALKEHQACLEAVKVLQRVAGLALEEGSAGRNKVEPWRYGPRRRHVRHELRCSWPPCGARFIGRRVDAKYCPMHRHPKLRVYLEDTMPHGVQASKPKPRGVTLLKGDALSLPKEGRDGKQN